jgi:branched-chain amino acid transport system ATP-binding protein
MTTAEQSIDESGATGTKPRTTLLEMEDVVAAYGGTTVLRNVSFALEEGQVLALLGPNGAGKTTALRTALGLLRPKSGTIRLKGEDITGAAPNARAKRGLCLIPEGRGIFRNLTVRENLKLQVPPWKKDGSIDAAIEAFPVLGERISQTAGTMSGGQQQMLALSRAFLSDPSVVLLDEVSMGLAPIIVEEIFSALERLASTGVALVLVEQYINRALEMADSVVVLDRGVVHFFGPASAVDEDSVIRAYLGGRELGESLENAVHT